MRYMRWSVLINHVIEHCMSKNRGSISCISRFRDETELRRSTTSHTSHTTQLLARSKHMATSAPLTTHNASVHTATVTINTLTVSGKQVTQAVFRQLIESELINYDGTFAGLPWGTVNYHPNKNCQTYRRHLHVVWQDGDQLRQNAIQVPYWDEYWSDTALPDHLLIAGGSVHDRNKEWFEANRKYIAEHPEYLKNNQDRLTPDYYWKIPKWGTIKKGDEFHFTIDGVRCMTLMPHNRHTPEIITEFNKIDYDETLRLFRQEIQEEKARRIRHHARWEEICNLPQLFIAV